MRAVLVTLVTATLFLSLPGTGLGAASGSGLEVGRAKVRLHRYRGESRDRMTLRGVFPMLQEEFDPRRGPVDLLVAGTEVLCLPGDFPLPTDPDPDPDPAPLPNPSPNPTYPSPIDPPDYGPPGPGNPGIAPREWTLQERTDGTWVYRAEGRRLALNLREGTIVVSGRNLDLDAIFDAGPDSVDIAIVMGGETFGTVVGFDRRGRSWRYAAGR